MKSYVMKGDICYSKASNELCVVENGYVVCEDGRCTGVFEELPEAYKAFPLYDYENKIIIPGLVDLHVHAPQYPFRGLGMDLELIDWLNTHTFVEEAKYANLDYADKAYDMFVEDLAGSATTRACVFGTIHTDATLLLMDKMEKAGLNVITIRILAFSYMSIFAMLSSTIISASSMWILSSPTCNTTLSMFSHGTISLIISLLTSATSRSHERL